MNHNTKIFASIVDDVTKKQVEDFGKSEAYNGCTIRIMPDCHAGMGCTIGSVIKFNDRVVPNTVGVDIGCGMLVSVLGNIDVDLVQLDNVVNRLIPSGFNINDKAKADFPMTFNASIKDVDYILRSIGSLGGGNHFIELDIDEDNNKYLVIHSGSRNLGVQVCNYWQSRAIENLTDNGAARNELIARLKAEGRQREIGNELKKIEQKPTWSEEDEKKRTLLINILEVNHPNGYFKVNPANTLNMEAMHTEELISWLKSLRPQNTWKPSKEQMEALYDSIPQNVMEISKREMLLDSLYIDLRKL